MLRQDPYMGEDASAAYVEESYNEPYARRMPAATTVRQPVPNTRQRPPADDMFVLIITFFHINFYRTFVVLEVKVRFCACS